MDLLRSEPDFRGLGQFGFGFRHFIRDPFSLYTNISTAGCEAAI